MRLTPSGECVVQAPGYGREKNLIAQIPLRFGSTGKLVVALTFCLATVFPVCAEQIQWLSTAQSTNLQSGGANMDGSFVFELGVFAPGFTPTPLNTHLWKANWTVAPGQRQAYNPVDRLYFGDIVVDDDYPGFSVGQSAYVWGFNAHGDGKEWILFRRNTWTWPVPNPFPSPIPLRWKADEANEIIVGSINASGTPHLMRTARIENSELPPTPWSEWQAIALAGESENAPGDDPDEDGCTNLLEFVFGTDPRIPGPPVKPTFDLMALAPDQFARLTIPRRRDRLANLWVEVSVDLQNWSTNGDPGGPFTTTVSDTAAAWIVRDLTPVSPGQPKRFLRMGASLP